MVVKKIPHTFTETGKSQKKKKIEKQTPKNNNDNLLKLLTLVTKMESTFLPS